MTSAPARPPRSSPSASTRMLLPAPVSPVIAVRPGPKEISASSISATPEIFSSVNTVIPSSARARRLLPLTLPFAPRQLLSQDPEEAARRSINAQRLRRAAPLDRRPARQRVAPLPVDGERHRPVGGVADLEARVGPEYQ